MEYTFDGRHLFRIPKAFDTHEMTVPLRSSCDD